MGVMRKKGIEESIADTEGEHQLKKNLGPVELTMFGVGVVIGAGIFTMTGKAAHQLAGPSVVFSFILAAVGCALAALCYAEFASTVPVSGSAYTFSYASMGEIIAWIIGWDLLLELLLGASVVAQGWSSYVSTFFEQLGIHLPKLMMGSWKIDYMAMLLIAVLTVLIVVGIKESMRVNMILVGVKLFIVLFVIVAGLFYIRAANYTPFIPPAQPAAGESSWLTAPLIQVAFGMEPSAYGIWGIFSGAALVFFAYIGFDVVATTAEEARNPQKDLPIGIIASLLICTVLYCAVALVITGMQNYKDIHPKAALAEAFAQRGQTWMAVLISAGAVAGLTTVVLTLMIGATRVVFAMARDRLLPSFLAKVHPKFRTPWVVSIIIGGLALLMAGFVQIDLGEMVNIGTLSAFVLVSIGVIVLRRTRPELERGFRTPLVPVIPILAALVCLYMMLNLPVETWLRFLVWMALGFAIYLFYGQFRSKAHDEEKRRAGSGAAAPNGGSTRA